MELLNTPCTDFANLLPFYSGSFVKIRIGSSSDKYKLSKSLVCKHSKHSTKMFQGNFREGEEQSATLEEIEGTVSVRSFEMLVEWFYLGRVNFGDLDSEETITAAIEFTRIADMCGVAGLEDLIGEHVKDIITGLGVSPTSYITCQRIRSAAYLPQGHAVRGILASAAVRDYLQYDEHKFSKEAKEVPECAVDLLEAAKTALKIVNSYRRSFTDPITGRRYSLIRN